MHPDTAIDHFGSKLKAANIFFWGRGAQQHVRHAGDVDPQNSDHLLPLLRHVVCFGQQGPVQSCISARPGTLSKHFESELAGHEVGELT